MRNVSTFRVIEYKLNVVYDTIPPEGKVVKEFIGKDGWSKAYAYSNKRAATATAIKKHLSYYVKGTVIPSTFYLD